MNKKHAEFIKEPWYVQGFNACNLLICQGPKSAMVDCHSTVGYGHTKNLFIFDKDYLEYHYSVNDLKNIGNIFLKKQKENPSYFDWMINESRKFEKKLENYRKEFKKIDIKNTGNAKLIKIFHHILGIDTGHMGYSHILEGIAYVVDPMLEKGLKKIVVKKGMEDKFKEYFTALTQPTRPSLINEENISILKIAKSISQNKKDLETIKKEKAEDAIKKLSKEVKDKIKGHADRYFWIQINYYIAEPLTEKDFVEKIKTIIETNPDFDELIKKEEESYEKNKKEKERIIKELGLNKELVELFDIAEKNMYWQDDRKKHMLTCVYHFNTIVNELAERYNIPFEYAKQLLAKEIDEETLEKIDKNNLKQRAEKCVIFLNHNEKTKGMDTEILVGKECDDFIMEFRKKEAEKIDDLRGICASAGTARGIVRVCRTIDDLNEFKQGEVLVSSMTRPEFVPAMKKAVAIVTDEGGITSHAAIVSREINLPCVIGTKVATKFLDNGDLVEVKANHGMVVVLERKEK